MALCGASHTQHWLSSAWADDLSGSHAQVLHTASNGGCRIVVGRTRADGSVGVEADVGHSVYADAAAAPAEVAEGTQAHARSGGDGREELLAALRYATIQLRPGVDTVILGSEGLW